MAQESYHMKEYEVTKCSFGISIKNKKENIKIDLAFEEAVSLYVIFREIFDSMSKKEN